MKKRSLKHYHNVNVPWHTHLYRAWIALFIKGTIPWHKHIYRSYKNLVGDPKFAPYSVAAHSTLPIDSKELLLRIRRLEHELNALRIRQEAISASYEKRLAQLEKRLESSPLTPTA